MGKIVWISLVLATLLANEVQAKVISGRLARKLLGDDELEDNLEAMVGDTELTPKYAVKRVKSLQNEVSQIRDQCTKYLYVIKNFISFHQIRKKHEMAVKEARQSSALSSMPKMQTSGPTATSVAAASTDMPPTGRRRLREDGLQMGLGLRDYGDIEAHENDFEALGYDMAPKTSE